MCAQVEKGKPLLRYTISTQTIDDDGGCVCVYVCVRTVFCMFAHACNTKPSVRTHGTHTHAMYSYIIYWRDMCILCLRGDAGLVYVVDDDDDDWKSPYCNIVDI